MQKVMSMFRKGGRGPNADEGFDRNVEEEIARNLWANHKMLPPESKHKKMWDAVVVALVMYNSLCIPLVVGYNMYHPVTQLYWYDGVELSFTMMIWDYLVDLIFVADMMLTFRTTFFDADNELVLDKKVITQKYLKSWFAIDLISTIPFELVGLARPAGARGIEIKFKLFRLCRLTKVIKKLDVHNNVIRVSEMLILFIVIAHIVGALWWSLGVAPLNRAPAGKPPGTSWVVRAEVCQPNDQVEGEEAGLAVYCSSATLMQKYMSSLYWSLTTLIKTPWVHPDTIYEKIVASGVVVFGAIFFAAILGNITAMINSFDKSNAQLRDIMSTLHRLIGKYDVPAKLQKRVFMYVQTQWSTTKGLDNQRILAKIPPALRGDILEAIHSDLREQSPLFQRISHECVRVLLSKLRSEVCLAKETLLAPGQLCSEVFLLVRGVLQVQPGDDGDGKKKGGGFKGKMLFRAIEKPGSLVGMRDPFEKDARYPFHVIAVKQAQLVVLTAKDLMEVFAMDNRSDIEAMCDVLEKEFNDVHQALVKGQEGAGQRRGSSMTRRRSSTNTAAIDGASLAGGPPLSDHEEVHQRISVIEDTLKMCESEMRSIQEHLQLLPQLCELLNIPLQTVQG